MSRPTVLAPTLLRPSRPGSPGAARLPAWRVLVGAAPPLCAASLAGVSTWADADPLRLALARGLLVLLAVLAALGAVVAWRTARQRRAGAPTTIAHAAALAAAGRPAQAAILRGRVHPLPDAPPLVSPGGELCLWFGRARGDSVRPFLLVDASGQCVVLPAGAHVSAGAASSARGRGAERLLRDGDRVQVAGRVVPDSAEARALHAHAAVLVARSALAESALVSSNRPAARRQTRADAARGLPFADTTSPDAAPATAAGLPLVVAPAGPQPFAIAIVGDEPAGDLFGALALVDVLVLAVAAGLAAWPVFVAA
ncbi:MAG: hypothetical protein ACTHL8_06350 [Burkholderiaceae bacterium]